MSTKSFFTPTLLDQYLTVVDHHRVACCIFVLAAIGLVMAIGFALKLASRARIALAGFAATATSYQS